MIKKLEITNKIKKKEETHSRESDHRESRYRVNRTPSRFSLSNAPPPPISETDYQKAREINAFPACIELYADINYSS
mgnify:CR=1 FL=1